MGEKEGTHTHTGLIHSTVQHCKPITFQKNKRMCKKIPNGPELHSNVLVAGLNITLNPFRDYETALIGGTALSKNIRENEHWKAPVHLPFGWRDKSKRGAGA